MKNNYLRNFLHSIACILLLTVLSEPANAQTFGLNTTGTTNYPPYSFGYTTAGASWDEGGTGNTNTLRICRFTLSSPMTATSIYINVTNTSGSYTAYTKAFIYTDNGSGYPGTKVAESSIVNVQANGWVTFTLPPTFLNSNGTTTYWIGCNAYVSATPIERIMFDAGTTNQSYRIDGSYGGSSPTAPSGFPGGATGSARKLSAYVSGVQIMGFMKATKAVLTANGNITSMSFYTHAAGNARLAIYADNGSGTAPVTRLWESSDITVTSAGQPKWNSVDISSGTPSGISLNSGTYWLCWQWNGTASGPSYTTGSAGDGYSVSRAYGGFPASWSGGNASAEKWSLYASYCATSSPPTSITGNNSICPGGSTSLTTNGGVAGLEAEDIWYTGACPLYAFDQEWLTQPYATYQTTVNSVSNGILNVTCTGTDPMIHMENIGSFNTSTYKYISIRYKVVSGTAGFVEIYYSKNGGGDLSESQVVRASLVSDNTWHFVNVNMTTSANWTGTITGWRYDWCTGPGTVMDLDFITLSSIPILDIGTSVTVTPASTTTYYTLKKGACNTTPCASLEVSVGSALTVSIAGYSNPGCYSGNDGTIDVTVSGGTAPYYFSVNNGADLYTRTYTGSYPNFTLTGLSAGTQYKIRVKDSTGCVSAVCP